MSAEESAAGLIARLASRSAADLAFSTNQLLAGYEARLADICAAFVLLYNGPAYKDAERTLQRRAD